MHLNIWYIVSDTRGTYIPHYYWSKSHSILIKSEVFNHRNCTTFHVGQSCNLCLEMGGQTGPGDSHIRRSQVLQFCSFANTLSTDRLILLHRVFLVRLPLMCCLRDYYIETRFIPYTGSSSDCEFPLSPKKKCCNLSIRIVTLYIETLKNIMNKH